MKAFRVATGAVLAVLTACAVLAMPAVAHAVPTAPTWVVAVAPRGNAVYVNWEPCTGYSSAASVQYYVWRSSDGVNYTKIPGAVLSGLGECQYIDNGSGNLRTSTRYWYAVSARDGTGESGRSATTNDAVNDGFTRWQLMAPTTRAPLEPRSVTATTTTGTVTLRWSAVVAPNIAGYNVYRLARSGEDGAKINSSLVTTLSFADSTVIDYTHYWYRVSAVDTSGAEGFKSLEVHARPEMRPPAFVPHGGYRMPGSAKCMVCHDLHVAPRSDLVSATVTLLVQEVCYTCHDGTGSQNVIYQDFADTTSGARHPVAAGSMPGTLTCPDCHTPHAETATTRKLLSVEGTHTGNPVCYGCHGAGSTLGGGDMRIFESSSHNTSIPAPKSGTGVKCSVCHLAHASPNDYLWEYDGYRACFTCHQAATFVPGTPDVYERMTASVDTDTHHDVMKRDQDANGTFMACQNCHNSHSVQPTAPLVDPENPSPQGRWTGTYRAFCESCHDLSLPTALQTLPWVSPPLDGGHLTENIKDRYANYNVHGDQQTNTESLVASMGFNPAVNEVLECNMCHDPHGTVNNYNLRADVWSRDRTYVKRGVVVFKRRAGEYDLRFFCFSCHNPPTSHNKGIRKNLANFPLNCTAGDCHKHNSMPKQF